MTDQHTQTDPSRPRRGRIRRWIARRLRSILSDTDPIDTQTDSPAMAVTASVNRTETIAFLTPSKGDAYDFSVGVDLCFCATGLLASDSLDAKIRDRVPAITTEVTSTARAIGREYPPFRPGAAEPKMADAVQQAVDTALAAAPDEDGAVFACTVRVRVDMPEAVREMQRRAVADQVKFEAQYEQSEQTAQRLGELRDAWSAFIREGLPSWDTPYAVHMAQRPAQTASMLFTMREDRKQEARDLIEQVGAVAAEHERLDLLEFALVSDSALRKAYELLEIAQPEAGPESTFGEPARGEAK